MQKEGLIIEKLTKNQLNGIFIDFLMSSDFAVEEHTFNGEKFIIHINDGVRKFEVHCIIKNISNGGWNDSYNDVKRIQVGNVKKSLVKTNKIRTHMLCGIGRYNEKEILVVWNSYRYTTHNTNCSCYVTLDSIKKCYDRGYILVRDHVQEIWLCDKKHFNLLVRDYINFNYVME